MTTAKGGGGMATFATLLGVMIATYGAIAILILVIMDAVTDEHKGRK